MALITTKYGDIDEQFLTPNHSVVDNDHEYTQVWEYLRDGEVVHRSVHVTLKRGLGIESALGQLGG